MKFMTREISMRAVLAVALLTLVGSVVLGRENAQPPQVVALATPAASTVSVPEPQAELDLQKIRRTVRTEDIKDPFTPRQAAVAPPPEVSVQRAPPPPAPAAPPLPFTYLGKYIDGEKMEVFIARSGEHYTAEKGKTIEGEYKVANVTETAVTFIYLPLGTRQTLPIPAPK